MNRPELRSAHPEDCTLLADMEAGCTPFPWRAQQYKDSLATGHQIQIASINGQPIGAAVWMTIVDEADLLNIFINKAQQQRGYGYWLLQQIIAQVCRAQLQRLVLEVRRSNLAAIQLYQRCGFTECGLRKQYYPAADGREDALLMEKIP